MARTVKFDGLTMGYITKEEDGQYYIADINSDEIADTYFQGEVESFDTEEKAIRYLKELYGY